MTNPAQPMPPQPLSPSDERLWASLAHFGNIIGFLPSLLIFLILGGRSTFVKQESREALNWSLTLLIGFVALAILNAILGAMYNMTPSGVDLVFGLLQFVVGLAQFALWVVNVIFSIIAGLRVTQGGGGYRYPVAIRFIK